MSITKLLLHVIFLINMSISTSKTKKGGDMVLWLCHFQQYFSKSCLSVLLVDETGVPEENH